jgi:hypothetical protein
MLFSRMFWNFVKDPVFMGLNNLAGCKAKFSSPGGLGFFEEIQMRLLGHFWVFGYSNNALHF